MPLSSGATFDNATDLGITPHSKFENRRSTIDNENDNEKRKRLCS
jgi:hypothetical protein